MTHSGLDAWQIEAAWWAYLICDGEFHSSMTTLERMSCDRARVFLVDRLILLGVVP